MSLLDNVKAEIEKARADLEARITDVIRVAKVGEAALAADVKTALEKAKAIAIAEVQKEEPAAAVAVSQALAALEQDILAVLASHVIG